MLFSHSYEDDQFSYFASFLNHLINGEQKYKEVVLSVLDDAHKLVIGAKNAYSIDRESFPVIVFLSKQAKEIFKTLDVANITPDKLEEISKIISGHSATLSTHE